MAPQRILIVVTALVAGTVAPAVAQDAPLILEVHGGAAIPFGDLADGDGPGMGATAGPTLAVTFALPGSRWRTLYGGFSQHRFGCEAAGCDADGRYVATGFNVGVRIVPIRDGSVIPWIRIGAVTTRVETDDLAASPEGEPHAGVSELGFGGEAGIGFLVPLGPSVAWSATGLATSVTSELPSGASLPVRFFSLQTGLTLLF